MYTILHRTGISGGRVYNHTGDNITAYAPGAGNAMVGPWVYDYTAFPPQGDGPGEVLFDSEFSGILLDGRGMQQSTSEGVFWPDLDEDEDLDDARSVVKSNVTRSARITSCLVRLYHTSVPWDDARVWLLSEDGTYTPRLDTNSDPQTLASYLDELEGVADDRIWHVMRHALRIPVMWAIYHCPLTPRYPGLTEMITENTATTVAQSDLMSYGPVGMLRALYGTVYAAQHGIRLYEAALANFRPVERGMFSMPYDSAQDDDLVDPDMTSYDANFIDTMSTIGGPLPIPEATDVVTAQNTLPSGNLLETPAQRARGRIYTTAFGTGRDMSASPKRMTVWHFQTCPVRVNTETPAGGGTQNVIIGGLTSPFEGPPVRIVYHEANARYRAR